MICPTDHPHDRSQNCYNHHRCRCEPCSTSKREYNYWYRHMKPLGKVEDRFTDSTGTVRRIRALMRMGWTATQLAAHIGGTKQNVISMTDSQLVFPATARRVAAVYDRLWDREPPGGRSTHTVNRAVRKGWAGPLDFDDIDNDPEPATTELDTDRAAFLIAELDHFRGTGESPYVTAAAVGREASSLAKLAYRHGRPDLARWVEKADREPISRTEAA